MIVDCCVILLTILFPPVGVFIMCGCGADLCINICLTCLGYFPGHIHAFYIMLTRPSPSSSGRIQQYQYTQLPPQGYQRPPPQQSPYMPPPSQPQQQAPPPYYSK
ncbi:MAG: hypothetical protein EXX96DRAFT_233367 [Benjaminiella poitrasii]|nr:MAG: hypothetical protein EXX96DRAFT_233367 [Benjaminiella poitrasii]